MTVYIALLRGINVGGKNIIKMAELRAAFEAVGLCDVKTYIQSGNVLFKSDENEESLRRKLEHKISEAFGVSTLVILRTVDEVEHIIQNCPFSKEEISEAESSSDAESLYVSLLAQAPLPERIEHLNPFKSQSDKYEIIGREVFLLFSHSIRDSKLANNLYKLDVPGTVRNWKTMNKLAALAKAMEA